MWRSAQRRYIRISISAQSAASTPPAPERIEISGVALVVLPGQQGADLERLDRLGQPVELGVRLGEGRRVVLLLCQLDHDLHVVEPAAQAGDPLELGLQDRQPPGDPLGVGLVVPEVGCGDLLAELGDLRAHRVEVEHLLDARQGRSRAA